MEKVASNNSKKKEHKKELILSAIVKSFGIITPALKSISLSSATLSKWRREDPAFDLKVHEAIKEGDAIRLDRAEFVQAKLLDSKEESMRLKTSMYILNNKGKDRGYNNDVEQVAPKVNQDFSRLTPEELALLRKLTAKLEGKDV